MRVGAAQLQSSILHGEIVRVSVLLEQGGKQMKNESTSMLLALPMRCTNVPKKQELGTSSTSKKISVNEDHFMNQCKQNGKELTELENKNKIVQDTQRDDNNQHWIITEI